ncbi:hypothetical protein EA187_18355 [Lujinxingia sediminis]|uniref:Protein kinase domain-containing protein n=1 Tax=Lujinxingia sediminis TaxID=2480984 RepID=A0ABY0CNG1_9DELT|nr:bifunctional serine/threonine-protein kinase/formylglycine-generating enzyme family protein [Lujinxingia sediminis]RVU41509.1 hypothetical protein EA187_18355 [Lujinxingia sediminis]
MASDQLDLRLGQLALARGVLSLSALIKAATFAGTQGVPLGEALLMCGSIAQEALEELERDLALLSDARFEEVLAHGDTLILEDLESQRVAHTLDRMNAPGASSSLPGEREFDGERTPPGTPLGRTPTLTGMEDAGLSRRDLTDSPRLNGSNAEARYDFVDELGRGGMGQILLARDQLLEREIALKTLLPDSDNPTSHQRLLAEARLTGRLEHPSIVPVYDVGWLHHGSPYYTMRVVRERSLAAILDELREGRIAHYSLTQLVGIVRQVCLAIQYAHDAGVVHRDLKPDNILIGSYGEVFVIDWGIAKVLHGDDPHTSSLPRGTLVGTPQYMAPEQAQGHNDQVDERTDVYALGAILYEVLTLKTVFESRTVLSLLISIIQDEPVSPSRRAPTRQIPRTIEEIALKALAKAPDDRYGSAQALADELNLFLEGVKERERQKDQALHLVEAAHSSRALYQEARQDLAQAIRKRDELRRSIPSWAPPQEKSALWEIEARVDQLGVEAEKRFGEVTRQLSQSLGYAPLNEAHDALAELYWERFLQAEAAGDHATATYFESLVRQHNTGAFDQRLSGEATLEVDTVPPSATLQLWRVSESQRRLISQPIGSPGQAPESFQHLPHGAYALHVSAEGYASLEFPLALERLAHVQVHVPMWPNESVPDDFVVISAGPFRAGAHDALSLEQDVVELDAFALQRTPVTCGQYVEFLNAIAADAPDAARRHAPRVRDDMPSYFPLEDGHYVVPHQDAEGDAWDPTWPICIINRMDALAYIAWRSKVDGRPYRLPSSLEWEKAARGVDGRLYPWGHHFDASFCHMRESAPGKSMPKPVGATPTDRSPYGVLDMAGNIAEWTSTPADAAAGTYVLRGGSFNSFPLMCRLDWHQTSPEHYRHVHYGFRMALDLAR